MTFSVRKLAIVGAARSGKSTVGDYLTERYGFQQFAFADRLKRMMHELFPNIPQEPKPRRAYQVFGEGIRNLDLPGAEDVWINACLHVVEAHIWWHSEVDARGANVVITDLRSPREYARLRAEGFTIIRVVAPEALRIERAQLAGDDFSKADLSHATEQYVDRFDVDYEIVNSGTVAELKAKVDAIMYEMEAVG